MNYFDPENEDWTVTLTLDDDVTIECRAIAVFTGRLLPGVRTFISLPAGIAQFPLPEFVILTILGTLPWTIFLVYVGSELGHNWTMILDYKLEIAAACAAISACIGLAYYIYHKRKSK